MSKKQMKFNNQKNKLINKILKIDQKQKNNILFYEMEQQLIHNFVFKKVHKTKNFYRMRQHDPIKGKKYYNKKSRLKVGFFV